MTKKTFILHQREPAWAVFVKEVVSCSVMAAMIGVAVVFRWAPLAVAGGFMSLVLVPIPHPRARLSKLAAVAPSELVKLVIPRRETVASSVWEDVKLTLTVAALFGPSIYVGSTGLVAWLPLLIGLVLLFFYTKQAAWAPASELEGRADTMLRFVNEWDGVESPITAVERMGFKESRRDSVNPQPQS